MAFKGERSAQLNYWKEHSAVLSVEAMMLDSQASKLDKEERPEMLIFEIQKPRVACAIIGGPKAGRGYGPP